jgi:hypothetical protein
LSPAQEALAGSRPTDASSGLAYPKLDTVGELPQGCLSPEFTSVTNSNNPRDVDAGPSSPTVFPGQSPPADMKMRARGQRPRALDIRAVSRPTVCSRVSSRTGRCRAPSWAARRRVCRFCGHPVGLSP